MPLIQTVLSTDTFKTWREATNSLIGILNMPVTGNPTQLTTKAEAFDITESAGAHIGCTVTENVAGDGSVDISAGEAFLRESNSATAVIRAVELTATTIAAGATEGTVQVGTNYIYADYNAGAPLFSSTAIKSNINDRDKVLVAVVTRSTENDLIILQVAGTTGDVERRLIHRLRDTEGVTKASGASLSEPTALDLAVSSGEFYYGLTEQLTPAFDTSTIVSGTATGGSTTSLIDTTKDFTALGVVAGDVVWDNTNNQHATITSVSTTTNPNDTLNFAAVLTSMSGAAYEVSSNSFEYYYNGASGWTENAGHYFDNTQYNNYGTGLTALSTAYYTNNWIYLKIGTNATELYVVYGTSEFASLGEAQSETPPQNIPPEIEEIGVLIGRAILQEGNANIVSLDVSIGGQNFAASGASEFADNVFAIFDEVDSTKKAGFQVSGLQSGTSRIFEFPDKNGRLATYDDIHRRYDEVYKYASMAALSKRIIPYDMTISYGVFEDGTSITVNGQTLLSDLEENSVGTLAVLQGDIVESNKPISVKDNADGNIIAALSGVGEYFYFYTDRAAPHEVFVYAPYYDVTVTYSTSPAPTVSENVWDPVLQGETNTITVEKGTIKNFYVQYDPASPAGPVPNPAPTEAGHHYFHTSGPVVITKEGTGSNQDHLLVMPMGREILHPWIDGNGAQLVRSYSGITPAHIGNGYYIADEPFQTFSNADGAGSNGHTGIPYEMCGDTYMIEHDIAGYQICAIEPTQIRIFVADSLYAEIDATAASRTNPLFFSTGNASSGVPGVASLDATVGYVDFDISTASGTFQIGETVTQAVSGATGVVSKVFTDRLILHSITGTFDTTNTVTGGTSGATCVLTATPYRMWRFEASSPFALRTNDPQNDEYIALGYRRALRADSFDQTAQLDKKLHTLEDEIQERAPFATHFDPDLDYEWVNHLGNGVITNVDSSTIPGTGGGNVREVTGQRWDIYDEKIPFNPETLYKVSARVRMTVAPTVAGKCLLYVGVAGIAADGSTFVNANGINSFSNQFYVAANGRDLEADGANVWVTVVGYFKGHSAAPGSGASADPLNPKTLQDNCRFFKPLIVVNYSNGDGTVQIDWVKVEEANEDADIATESSTRATDDATLQTNIDGVQTNLDAHTATPHQTLLTADDPNAAAILATGDWNNYIDGGFYRGNGLLNEPAYVAGAHTWKYVTVIRHNINHCVQYMIDFNNVASWTRTYVGGVWGTWNRLDPGEHAALTNNPHSVTIDQISPLTVDGDILYRNNGASTRLPIGALDYIIRSDGAAPYWTPLTVQASELAGPTAGTGYNLINYNAADSGVRSPWNSWQTMSTHTYRGASGQVKVRVRSYQSTAFVSGYQTHGRILHNGTSVVSANATSGVAGWGGWSSWVTVNVNDGDTFTRQAWGWAWADWTISLDVQMKIACSQPSGYSII